MLLDRSKGNSSAKVEQIHARNEWRSKDDLRSCCHSGFVKCYLRAMVLPEDVRKAVLPQRTERRE
jgi:hypothetical protein